MTIHSGIPLYIWVTIHRDTPLYIYEWQYIEAAKIAPLALMDKENIMMMMSWLWQLWWHWSWWCDGVDSESFQGPHKLQGKAPEDIFIHLRHNLLTKFWIWGKTKQITSLYITTLKDYICPPYTTSIFVQVYFTCAHNRHSWIWVTTQRSTISSASVTKRAPAVASTRYAPGPSTKK